MTNKPEPKNPPKEALPHVWARRICFGLAWLCWIACLPLVFLAVVFVFDSGPHGAFGALPIVFGFLALLCGGLGWFLYSGAKSERE